MNNKAQATIYLSIVLAAMIFMIGVLFVNFIKLDVTTARTSLDCTNTSISDGNKLSCLVTDSVVPYFIILIFAASGGIILAKIIV